MKVIDSIFDSIKVFEVEVYHDPRGFFHETFRENQYAEILGSQNKFVQDNQSLSKNKVLRGLHFQKKNPQGKLIRVSYGEVFDVCVDIRKGSATFGEYFGIVLSHENSYQLWVPPGFAHGFIVRSNIAILDYKCTNYYDPNDEVCLLYSDPDINIDWGVTKPIISEKDNKGLLLKDLY